MARPRRDGTPPRETNRRKLTDLFVTSRKGGTRDELIWDVRQPGLALSVRTTGKKAWKVVYRFHGRPRWLHLGDIRSIGLADARRHAAKTVLDVLDGKDPVAQLQAARNQAPLPNWRPTTSSCTRDGTTRAGRHREAGRALSAAPLGQDQSQRHHPHRRSRRDGRMSEAPITANQVLASASAIFSWAVKQEIVAVNPCHGVDRNPTSDRERVLSDAEVATLWPRLDPALKLLLLTGQRPGEVAAMQAAHIVDGFWQMPGKPLGDWPGTKNGRDHRVALSKPALELIESHLRKRSSQMSSLRLKKLVAEFALEKVTPHDLRRTCLDRRSRGWGSAATPWTGSPTTGRAASPTSTTGTATKTRTGGSWPPSRATSSAWSRGRQTSNVVSPAIRQDVALSIATADCLA